VNWHGGVRIEQAKKRCHESCAPHARSASSTF
jgi:hypothetical protein